MRDGPFFWREGMRNVEKKLFAGSEKTNKLFANVIG